MGFFPFQYAYYVLKRDHPEEWKCQPNHWLSPELELHEMVVGAFSLTIGSFISSAMACWVMNDGYSTIYFDPAQVFIFTDPYVYGSSSNKLDRFTSAKFH